MKKVKTSTCEECEYSSPAEPDYYISGYIRCNEKKSDFGKAHDKVYLPKNSLCNIFKRKV